MTDRYENREAKLPVWAQAKLERLRRTIMEQKNQIDRMTGDAYAGRMGDGQPAIVADPYLHPRVVGLVGDTLQFGIEDGNHISVKLNPFAHGRYSLTLLGRDGTLAASPRSANGIDVWMDGRR